VAVTNSRCVAPCATRCSGARTSYGRIAPRGTSYQYPQRTWEELDGRGVGPDAYRSTKIGPMDAVALTSVLASGAVGLAGVMSAVAGGSLDRRHQRLLAAEARQQARLEDAYVDLLKFVKRVNLFLTASWPPGDPEWRPAPGRVPSAEEHANVAAVVAAYGSREVRAAEKVWWQTASRSLVLSGRLHRLDAIRSMASQESWLDSWEEAQQDFWTSQDSVMTSAENLIELVNGELRHLAGSPPIPRIRRARRPALERHTVPDGHD
jgi:hypothetical protein